MLYYLFRFLEQYGISGSHLWGYISFRALLAMILSLVISSWFGERFIKYLKRKQITETQRSAEIDPFGVNKVGVPSMGGIIIILAILLPVLLLGRLRNLPNPNDYHHSLVGFLRRNGRLYQDFQEE